MAEAPHRASRIALHVAVLLVLAFAVVARPALAQSMLRDAETEAMFRNMGAPLAEAAGLKPGNLSIVLLQSDEVNAFVAGGQIVYFFSETLTEADNANEVQGVLAHELGHVTGGHIIRMGEGMKAVTGISILSLVLAIAAAAAGAGDAGLGIMAAGQQAALGKFLAFSRTQESSADQAGATYLSKAGISGKGSISFFKKLQNMEFRLAIPQTDAYARTHPLSGERMTMLEAQYKADPAWDRPSDAKLEAQFQRVKAKLFGYVKSPERTFRRYPEKDQSVPARYARAYAWHKSAYPDRALKEVQSLLAGAPDDPYFLELEGQILLESGRPADALAALRKAVAKAPNEPLIAGLLGHALIATEDEANFAEAKSVLKNAVARDSNNPFAWYQLGIVYAREGDIARAALATAERYNLQGEPGLAMGSAERALQDIPTGTPDWLRAQDIAMTARAEAEREKKNR